MTFQLGKENLRKSRILPNNVESFIVLTLTVLIVVFSSPEIIESVNTAQPEFPENFEVSLEADHDLKGLPENLGIDQLGKNYSAEGESRINISCKGMYYFVRDTRLFECTAQIDQISLDPDVADEIEGPMLKMTWEGLNSTTKYEELLDIDDLDNFPEKFYIDSPDTTGRYSLELEGADRTNVTVSLDNEPILVEDLEVDEEKNPNIENIERNFITRNTLNNEILRASSVYFNMLLIFSIVFAGFSIIMRLNKEHLENKFSKVVTDKEFYLKKISLYLILIGIVLMLLILIR